MRYVAPIVNERAWIAERAAAVKLRKGNEQIALVDVVTNRLESLASDEVGLAWDAWRRDDGLWAIKLSYRTAHGPREAKWIFDSSVSSIAPDDAEAEWLMEIEPPATPAAEKPPRRLVSVPAPVAAEPELEAEPEPAAAPAPAPVMHSPAAEVVREPVDDDATAEHERPKIPSWDEILFGSPARPRE
jgi:hypothetical protein